MNSLTLSPTIPLRPYTLRQSARMSKIKNGEICFATSMPLDPSNTSSLEQLALKRLTSWAKIQHISKIQGLRLLPCNLTHNWPQTVKNTAVETDSIEVPWTQSWQWEVHRRCGQNRWVSSAPTDASSENNRRSCSNGRRTTPASSLKDIDLMTSLTTALLTMQLPYHLTCNSQS